MKAIKQDTNKTSRGVKHDKDKPRWDLIPLSAVEEIVRVMTYGASKYSENGWKEVEKERYLAALLRHLAKYQDGEMLDKESGLTHIAHAACNALFLVWKVEEEWKQGK